MPERLPGSGPYIKDMELQREWERNIRDQRERASESEWEEET